MPERNDDVSIRFLNFLLRLSFPSVKFREQRPAGRCTVSGSALSMSSFPDCRSRRAGRLQRRASSGDMITQKSTGREEGSRAEPLPQPLCGWDSPLAAGAAAPANEGCLHPLLLFYPTYCKSFLTGKSFGDYAQRPQFWGTVMFYQLVKSPPL